MKADYYNLKQAQENAVRSATEVEFGDAGDRNSGRYHSNGGRRTEWQRPAFTGKCNNCGRVGHKRVACRLPEQVAHESVSPMKKSAPMHMAKSM